MAQFAELLHHEGVQSSQHSRNCCTLHQCNSWTISSAWWTFFNLGAAGALGAVGALYRGASVACTTACNVQLLHHALVPQMHAGYNGIHSGILPVHCCIVEFSEYRWHSTAFLYRHTNLDKHLSGETAIHCYCVKHYVYRRKSNILVFYRAKLGKIGAGKSNSVLQALQYVRAFMQLSACVCIRGHSCGQWQLESAHKQT